MGTLVNGIKEIFATAKTTGSNVMLCGNDGTPDGHMTMSNLASVLGVQIYQRINSGQDLDDLYGSGLYVYEIGSTTGIINLPNGDSSWSTLLCVCSAGNQYTQIINGNLGDFVRHKDGNSSWGAWKELSTDIPTFYKNYNSLVSLAGAIGANYAYPALTSAADFNNYTHTGVVLVYTVAIQEGIQNAPTGIGYGYLEILSVSNTDGRIRQRYYSWGAKSYMAYRFYENESWGSWIYD